MSTGQDASAGNRGSSVSSDTISVVLNGERRSIPAGIDVTELLSLLSIGPERVAVEINKVLVSKLCYQTTKLASDDEIEIVSFIGGG